MSTAVQLFEDVARILKNAEELPYGPTVDPRTHQIAGVCCVDLCDGDNDRARALWKLIVSDLGYMPQAAAVSLIRAANTTNLVPDVTAPDPS